MTNMNNYSHSFKANGIRKARFFLTLSVCCHDIFIKPFSNWFYCFLLSKDGAFKCTMGISVFPSTYWDKVIILGVSF